MKNRFLILHDYGTGGLWKVVDARSSEEILDKFRDVKIVEPRPSWMTSDRYDELEKDAYDIDSAPTGWLTSLCR